MLNINLIRNKVAKVVQLIFAFTIFVFVTSFCISVDAATEADQQLSESKKRLREMGKMLETLKQAQPVYNPPKPKYENIKGLKVKTGNLSGIIHTRIQDIKISYTIQLKNMEYKKLTNQKEITVYYEKYQATVVKSYEGTMMADKIKKSSAKETKRLKNKKTEEYSYMLSGDAVITAKFSQVSKRLGVLKTMNTVVVECPFKGYGSDGQEMLASKKTRTQMFSGVYKTNSSNAINKADVYMMFEFDFNRKVNYSFQERLIGNVYISRGGKSSLTPGKKLEQYPLGGTVEGVLELNRYLATFSAYAQFVDQNKKLTFVLEEKVPQLQKISSVQLDPIGFDKGSGHMVASPKWPRPSGKKAATELKEPKDIVAAYTEKPKEKKKVKSEVGKEVKEDSDDDLDKISLTLKDILKDLLRNYNTNIDEMNKAIEETEGLTKWQLIAGKAISHLTGDLLDEQNSPKFEGDSPAIVYVNGIKTTDHLAVETITMLEKKIGFLIQHIENNTHLLGIGDLVQVLANEVGMVDITAVRMSNVLKQAIEQRKQVYVIAHSQGTMTFKQALKLLTPDERKHVHYQGYGGQTYIDVTKKGLAEAINCRNERDGVPYVGNDFKKNMLTFGNPITIITGIGSKAIKPTTGKQQWIYLGNKNKGYNFKNGLNPSYYHNVNRIYLPNIRKQWGQNE